MAVTDAQRQHYISLRAQGFSIPAASRAAGFSRTTGYRIDNGLEGVESFAAKEREDRLPDPKAFEDLSPLGQEMLRDFNLFAEKALCRRPSSWREKAAEEAVAHILDKSERSYLVANIFPGSGKSTLWCLDIPVWLVCGGGSLDPAYGRALRFMLGHETKGVSTHYTSEVRRTLDLRRPFYDKEQKRRAEVVLSLEFGRFKPDAREGEESLWRGDQFLVAQLGEFDLYDKEPTFQAASKESGFLGERFDYAAWDDLASFRNSRDPVIAESLSEWFEKEAETRIEPGGVLWLVGQRLGPLDLFRDRLNKTWVDDDGETHQRYEHIVFPAHHESLCDAAEDGSHRQWDGEEDGCLTDEWRMPWREILKVKGQQFYRTLYQQEESDPSSVLVLPVWLDGGTDHLEYHAPGCWDRDRGFYEFPDIEGLISYCTVDPSVSGWWAVEWWALHLPSRTRYLIYGARRKMQAGEFLDWDPISNRHVGLMEEIQTKSEELRHPIRVWIVEANAAHRYLFQFQHFRRWIERRRAVTVIPHTTGANKADAQLGIEATLPMAYRSGHVRLPKKPGTEALNYLRVKERELTTYPYCATDDTVLSEWFGHFNTDRIIGASRRDRSGPVADLKLPAYLARQNKSYSLERESA